MWTGRRNTCRGRDQDLNREDEGKGDVNDGLAVSLTETQKTSGSLREQRQHRDKSLSKMGCGLLHRSFYFYLHEPSWAGFMHVEKQKRKKSYRPNDQGSPAADPNRLGSGSGT